MKNKTLALKVFSVIFTVVLAVIDQFTKMLTVEYIKPVGCIPLIKIGDTEWLNFTYCENTGMSFSMLEGQRAILITIPILLIIAVEWYIFSGKLKRTDLIIALAALAGGGLGNLIDRVFLGYVVDFIDVRIINFAIFNFADICAVCGGIYFGAAMLIEEIKADKKKKNETTPAPTETGTDEQA
ncbi:MAG: signal peptidase II [Ruminiclostridium sp.]|nr:signal peptidase II [Ruminiclostridium sp.]